MSLLKNKNLISIIIVNWNGKKWLENCLNSLKKQRYKYIEIIIVDNASSDGSIEYMQKQFPKVKIVKNKKNVGFPKACNIGVKAASGKYLLIMNNDTWVKNDFVEKLFQFYQANDYSVISPTVREYDGKKVLAKLPNIDLTGGPAYFFPLSRKDKLFYLSSCYFCTKKIYLETGGFDDNYFAYYEDVDWFWRLNLLKIKFTFVRKVYIYHAGAGSTGRGIKYNMFLWRNQNALQTLLKNYSTLTLTVVLPIYFIQNLFEIMFFLALFKFDIAYSYVEGWMFNIKNLKKTLNKRSWVQKNRLVNDSEILKKIYWGSAKLKMLINYSYEK